MSSEFSVDLDQLDQIVSRLNGLAGFLRDHLDELDRKVATLRRGSWESAAANAYSEAHTQWLTAAREFADGVAAMSAAAQQAHGRYTRAVDVNRRMLESGQP
ncbi:MULTISPECIES: WXG100 family type VII secretion target [unclassified Nocardia]|uniref:WXG100 family type VII secretion target n=1 Tax=unclassified Nocardia TaxID=2637762 RepID=UPI001CE4B305|nr:MULTISPECIES: WXG100 family type VII secretion target [unclassified Nocardia]